MGWGPLTIIHSYLTPCEKCVEVFILKQKIGSVLRSSSLFNAGLVFYVLTLHLIPGCLSVINLLSVYQDGQLVYQGHLLHPYVCNPWMLFTVNFLWVPLCWHLLSSSPSLFFFLSLETHLPEESLPSSSPTVSLHLGVLLFNSLKALGFPLLGFWVSPFWGLSGVLINLPVAVTAVSVLVLQCWLKSPSCPHAQHIFVLYQSAEAFLDLTALFKSQD